MKTFEKPFNKTYKYGVRVPARSFIYNERFSVYFNWCKEQFGEPDTLIWTWEVDHSVDNPYRYRVFWFSNEEHRTFFILRFSA